MGKQQNRWRLYLIPLYLITTITYSLYKAPYDLESEQVYTHYMPERLKTLSDYIEQHSVKEAILWILTDDDPNSFLFIIQAKKPYHMLAWSREQQLYNKTAEQLQEILDPKKQDILVTNVFNRLISTSQKAETFAPFKWRTGMQKTAKIYVAYVKQIIEKNIPYVIGVAFCPEYFPASFILKHRVGAIINRIKKQGLENVLPILAHDPDPAMSFYIHQQFYPYRYLVDGDDDQLTLKTPREFQSIIYPDCQEPEICDLDLRYNRFEKIAKQKTGFYACMWPKESQLQLKVGYLEPMEYKKEHYIVGGFIELIDKPKNIEKTLTNRTNRTLKLIKNIGLDNTISVLHKENVRGESIFIDEINQPYTQVVNVDRSLENMTALQVKEAMLKNCRGGTCPDAYTALEGLAHFAKTGGGFYTYVWQSVGSGPRRAVLKVSFLKPFTYEGKEYDVGSGFTIE